MTKDRAGPGRRRSEATRKSVLDATLALMLDAGLAALTIEGVAARAGAGKMTIYRWWPGKGALAVDAFLTATSTEPGFSQEAPPQAAITADMTALAQLYTGPIGRLARAIVGASQGDPEIRKAFQQGFLFPRRRAAHDAFVRGVATGEFRSDIDPDVAIDALYGPIYYRMLTSDAPIDNAFIAQTATLVFKGILRPENADSFGGLE